MFGFERLEVWRKARGLTKAVYCAVDAFPAREQFALSQQLTRAAVSVAANIAEGSAKASNKEFSRYVEISFGSLCELIAELYVALDREYLSEDRFGQLYGDAERLGMMLSKLRGSLERSWVKTRSEGTGRHDQHAPSAGRSTIHDQTINENPEE